MKGICLIIRCTHRAIFIYSVHNDMTKYITGVMFVKDKTTSKPSSHTILQKYSDIIKQKNNTQ